MPVWPRRVPTASCLPGALACESSRSRREVARSQTMVASAQIDAMPVVGDPKQFDRRSGTLLERLVFNHRILFIVVCGVATALLAFQLTKLVINANFDKVIPHNHPYIKNYFDSRDKLGGVGNAVRVVVETTSGDIFDPKFLEITRKINQ